MLCRQGPLDGTDVPQQPGMDFFLVAFYPADDKSKMKMHVYGDVGDEWHYQADATHQVRSVEQEEGA